MPFNEKRSRAAFQRLARELNRLAKKPAPDSIHKFRTNSRRVEALLSDVAETLSRNDQKLLKLLGRLRKKAGRVRDLDVQILLLRSLRVPQGNGHKVQFLNILMEERVKRERKLAKLFTHEAADEISKRLKRAVAGIEIPRDADPVTITLSRLAGLSRDCAPLTERTLHQYRVIGKRARYVVELADDDPTAQQVIDDLKHMQDVIGDWHDWLKLTERGEELLGSARDSALCAMLRNVTQAKFRQSLDAVAELRASLAKNFPAASTDGRKPAGNVTARSAAVA